MSDSISPRVTVNNFDVIFEFVVVNHIGSILVRTFGNIFWCHLVTTWYLAVLVNNFDEIYSVHVR